MSKKKLKRAVDERIASSISFLEVILTGQVVNSRQFNFKLNSLVKFCGKTLQRSEPESAKWSFASKPQIWFATTLRFALLASLRHFTETQILPSFLMELTVDFVVLDEIQGDWFGDGVYVRDFVAISDAVKLVARFKQLGTESSRDELCVVLHFVHHFRNLRTE